jgi:hypothetical protein
MRRTRGGVALWLPVLALLWPVIVTALEAGPRCQASKNKEAGKYASCRQKAQAKLVQRVDAGDPEAVTKYNDAIDKCDEKFLRRWQSLEDRTGAAGGTCPDEPLDPNSLVDFITDHCDAVATALAGDGLPSCGDGEINVAGEHCDGTELGGDTCVSLGFVAGTLACDGFCLFDTSGCTARLAQPLKTGQTLCFNAGGGVIACAGTGQDGELQKGITRAYADNGDGTVTENQTGLMWEKLDDNDTAGIHDWDDTYTWVNAFGKITTLNTPPCFAGYCDWRLPNINELVSLTKRSAVSPAIDVAFFHTGCAPGCTATTCSCTQSDYYWSSTTDETNRSDAWLVDFIGGSIYAPPKDGTYYVRAVRGGL